MVENMPRSLAFYRALGLTIPVGAEEDLHVEVEVGGEMVLFWDAAFVGKYDADREEPKDSYRIVFEFYVESKEAVDDKYEELVESGYRGHKAPFETRFGAYMAMVDDPDANTVLLTVG